MFMIEPSKKPRKIYTGTLETYRSAYHELYNLIIELNRRQDKLIIENAEWERLYILERNNTEAFKEKYQTLFNLNRRILPEPEPNPLDDIEDIRTELPKLSTVAVDTEEE
jgi:hypothetical protein